MDIKIILLIVGFLIIAIYVSIDNNKKYEKKLRKKLTEGWGKSADRKYAADDFENISHYFEESLDDDSEYIDDITWNDLNMDGVYKAMNNTNSSVGQEFLYRMLRMPSTDKDQLKELDRLAVYFDSHEKERMTIQKEYVRLGYTKMISLSDYVDVIVDLSAGRNILHYFSLLLLAAAFGVCFGINAPIGIVLIIVAVSFSIISYYKYKADVEHYFVCITQIVKMINTAKRIAEKEYPELKKYNDIFNKSYKDFAEVVKNSGLLASTNVNGSLPEMIFDYVRMLTHVDLIKFNNMVKLLHNRAEDVHMLMDTLGFLESSIAVASFRNMLPYWSVPQLHNDHNIQMQLKDVYHPLIHDPVANSLTANRHVLLTGSNASGKSTFLKAVAINALLSQAIYTSTSKEYQAPFLRLYSSMTLQDDLDNNNSYYIVEIKALKRILDAVNRSGNPVLCFIDEVLRGTNTVERIAASSEILKSLHGKNVLCFAATHDIELTAILERYYDNYHFQEEVTDNDVKFNYRLFKGPATTRNAIKLLNIIGYDRSIIDGAQRQAGYFIENGIWKM